LGHLARKFSGLRRKDTRGHEEALHQFARRDNAHELADLTGLDVTAGESTLLALDDRPLFTLAKEKVGATVRAILAHEFR